MNNLKNKYFFLRHGQNIHQTEKKGILYHWPDDTPPCALTEEGIKEAERAGDILKDKNIDHIYSSDILRARETANIVANKIGYNPEEITYETRFRDVNWGIYGGKTDQEGWDAYDNDSLKRYEVAPPEGESWKHCQERMVEGLKAIEDRFGGKNILIVSHNDPLWLLEEYIKGTTDYNRASAEEYIGTGEIKEII